MKKYIIFDFDGTIMDGSACIHEALRKSCIKHNISMPSEEQLKGFIGPPIMHSMLKAGFDPDIIPDLLATYRVYCREKDCIGKFHFYDGIPEMLENLNKKGFKCVIVSMRTQSSLDDVDAASPYSDYFNLVYGRQGDGDSEVKSILVERTLDMIGAKADECVLVGDSQYDCEGAENCGIDFVAVLYGFGFESANQVHTHKYICNNVKELSDVLFNLNN